MSNKKTVKITLYEPIKGDDGKGIATITLKRPTVGELRGLMLAQVQMQHVSSLIKLVPRICTPLISEDQVADLDPADFAEVANAISGFFVKPEQLEAMKQEMLQ